MKTISDVHLLTHLYCNCLGQLGILCFVRLQDEYSVSFQTD